MPHVKILDANAGLGYFFSLFIPKNIDFSVLQYFYSFYDTCHVKYVLDEGERCLVPCKKAKG